MRINKKAISCEVKDINEPKGIVTFAYSKYGVKDSDGDIVQKGALSKTIKENFSRIKHLKFHDTRLSPGKIIKLYDDGDYAMAESQLNLETEIGRETFAEYKLGQITEHSQGFVTVKQKYSKELDANVITEEKLYEVSSLLAWGANEHTPMESIKSSDVWDLDIKDFAKAMSVKYEGHMVQCPDCSLLFDYNSVKENTFETQLLQIVQYMVNDMAWDEAYKLVQTYEGDISDYAQQVLMSAKGLKEPGLSEIIETAKYVNCPKCYTRISKSMHSKSTEPPASTRKDDEPLDFARILGAIKKNQ